jgi:hypothetical protein
MTTMTFTLEDLDLLERLLAQYYSMSRMSLDQENHIRSGHLIDELQEARKNLLQP